MLSLLLALASPDPFAAARADTAKFCRTEQTAQPQAQCVKQQKEQLGHFVKMMVVTDRQTAAGCMKGAKGERYVNWVKASACMRKSVDRR